MVMSPQRDFTITAIGNGCWRIQYLVIYFHMFFVCIDLNRGRGCCRIGIILHIRIILVHGVQQKYKLYGGDLRDTIDCYLALTVFVHWLLLLCWRYILVTFKHCRPGELKIHGICLHFLLKLAYFYISTWFPTTLVSNIAVISVLYLYLYLLSGWRNSILKSVALIKYCETKKNKVWICFPSRHHLKPSGG